MKSSFIEKVIARLDNLSKQQVEVVVERLAKEKGFLEQVMESLQEGVILFDSSGVAVFINSAAESMFGLQEQSCIGKSIMEFLPGFDWSSFSIDRDNVVSQDLEVLYPERLVLNVYSAPIKDPIEGGKSGSPSRVLLLRDITSQHDESKQTLESEKFNVLTMLAAGVAHEIGNPLNSLGIQLQLLDRKLSKVDDDKAEGMQRHITKARKEIGRLDNILKDFLHAIRPTIPNRERVDLNYIVAQTTEGMEDELVARKTQVRLLLSDSIPFLFLDEGQIHQALYNIIRNGSQSMPASGGELTIETKVTEYVVILSVQDYGSGISPEQMGRIYEPFQSTKKGDGTGLGLLIARRIIREHGGELKIESVLDEGTCVSLIFTRQDQKVKLLSESNNCIDLEN